MDKVLNISGGMPRRTTDLELVQNAFNDGIKAIVSGLDFNRDCILFGMAAATSGGNHTVTEGYYYSGSEIFYVPAATFAYDSAKALYIEPNIYQQDQRHFQDGTDHNCQEKREYVLRYSATPITGAVLLSSVPRLDAIVSGKATTDIYDILKFYSESDPPLNYYNGFYPISGQPVIKISKNYYEDVIFSGVFASSEPSGRLTVLPQEFCPPSDIVGHFLGPLYQLGALIIKSNGDVVVINCSETAPNFINFRYNQVYNDLSYLNIPVENYMETNAPIIIEGGEFPD